MASHYALVNTAGSAPLSVPREEDEQQPQSERDDLTRLFQHYAEMYPNPRLVEEYRLRNTLLQAASAAVQANHRPSSAPSRSKGFFARLFGGETDDELPTQSTDTTTEMTDAPLVYTELPNEHDDGSLCGTLQSLDRSCIPLEAMSVARFHLTSRRTRGNHPNAVRWGPLLGRSTPSSLIVVGLGVLAELQPNQESTLKATSDRNALLDYASSAQEAFQLDYVRACALSPNCILVSWGFQDGLVGVYRRIQLPPEEPSSSDKKNKAKRLEYGWEQLWTVAPSPPILEAIGDVFHDDASHPGSPLLRVSDLLPLRVTTGDKRQPMVATVALARLGGFIELVPIPTDMWFGPALTPETYKRPKQPKRKPGEHYAIGRPMGTPTVALTTAQYHVDVLTLEALRTTVGLETEWNNQAFPNAPPSEYILAASGLSAEMQGQECISFWSVCTLFTDDNEAINGFGFQLHASVLDTINVVSGAEVAIFATPEIMQHWRMPRHVELRPDAAITSDGTISTENEWKNRVTTIATPAPICSLQFLDERGSAILAVLDWNGGSSIYDCAPMERMASQQLTPEEFARFQLADRGSTKRPFPMIHSLVTRTQFAITIGRRNEVGTLHWLKPNPENEFGNQGFTPLVLLLRNIRQLMVVNFSFEDEYGQPIEEPKGSVLSLPFPGHGTTMDDLGSGNLMFVSQRRVSGQGHVTLKCFVMQQLQPTAIVESLAHEEKYQEAIAAAENLDELDEATLAEVVEECHRRIWESKRNIDSLADTRNISYIVEQALSLCESSDEEENELTLEKLRTLCQLAITMGRNHRPVKEPLNQIGVFLTRLGTYELLCQRFAARPSLRMFRNEFQRVPLVSIAKSIAHRGDVFALSIVVFRHRSGLINSIFEILADIPLSIHPEDFVHLIPIMRDGRVTDTFLPTMHVDAPLHLSHMPQHIKGREGVSIVIDQADEKMVLEQNALGTSIDAVDLKAKASQWFVRRSAKMQHFTGNMDSVVVFCEIGLRCNGFNKDQSPSPGDELQPLFKTWRSAEALQSILLGDFVSFQGSEESKEAGPMVISTDDLLAMELPKLVDLILRGESDSSKILSRCTDYLQPLLLELNADNMDSNGQGLDTALASYCAGLAADCNSSSRANSDTSRLVALATKTLGTCAAIATASRSSIRKQERLIKDKPTLIQMVIGVVRDVCLALEHAEIHAPHGRHLLDAIWTMYESLPDQLPSTMEATETYLPLAQDLDDLHADLVCADILTRWPGCKPFVFLARRQRDSSEFGPEQATGVIVRLCNSFAENAHRLKSKDEATIMLRDLLSDVEQLNKSCCSAHLDLPTILCTYLVRPLLQREHFNLVIEYCNASSSLVDKEQVKRAVLSHVDEAVFSEGDNANQVMSAMKCQDIIGPAFPEIQPGFLSIRRFLDAAHFISTVVYEGRAQRPMRPVELRNQFPLDVIESILQDVPQSITCGCPQWQDELYAQSSNAILRMVSSSRHPEFDAPEEMPVLPGGAIFHLATILGLEDEKSALVVKSRVITYAISVGLHGAAAAICRTMVGMETEEVADGAVALLKLDAVAEIVADDKYADRATKQELCQAALTKYGGRLEVTNSEAFNAICTVALLLEHGTSRHSRDYQQVSVQRHERLLARPVARLKKHILAEYNADLHGLFLDLSSQTSNGLVHDSLVNAMSRFVIYWCVSDSKTLRHRIFMSEKNDARANLALGCSLILQIPSKLTAGNCIHELQKVAADQAANVSSEDRFGSADSDICIPDPQLVGRMVARGYMENAARRSVAMTRNAGYTEALGWAFTHSMDSDFNEPIMIVHDPRRTYIDEDAIQLLQKSLYSTQCWIDDPRSMDSLLSFVSTLHKSAEGTLPTINRHTVAPRPATAKNVTPIDKHTNPVIPPPTKAAVTTSMPSKLVVPTKPVAAASNLKTPQPPPETKSSNEEPPKVVPPTAIGAGLSFAPRPAANGSSQDRNGLPAKKLVAQRLLVPATPPRDYATKIPSPRPTDSVTLPSTSLEGYETKIPSPQRAGLSTIVPASPFPQAHETKIPTPRAGSSTTAAGTPRTRESPARSELFRRGQEARSKLRATGDTTDRKKLIAEGRELLRKARSGKGSVAPAPPPAPKVAGMSPVRPTGIPSPKPRSTNNGVMKLAETPVAKDDASEGSGWDFDNFDDM